MFHVKQYMSDYLLTINILTQVFNGKNLNEAFTLETATTGNEINISKIKDLSFGVLRNYYILKTILNALVKKPLEIQDIETVLLIGIYEIRYSKRAEHAIVNELVNLSLQLSNNDKLKGLVNAVLRNYLRDRDLLEQNLAHKSEYKYGFPIWLISHLKKEYPRRYIEIMQYSNLIPKLTLRVNLAKISVPDYLAILEQNSIEFSLIENVIVLTQSIKVAEIPMFSQGYVSIQDIHAQKLIEIIKPTNGAYILDACCAPGGKMCQILEQCTVEMLGLDIDPIRLYRVKQNLDRLELAAALVTGDATQSTWWDGEPLDIIIADVPCSASGTMKRNPDIKLHRQLSDINNFVLTQRRIVLNLWKMLKPGGQLVYITCSIFKQENHDNIEFLCQQLGQIKIIKELNLLPTEYADGFYYCILEKLK